MIVIIAIGCIVFVVLLCLFFDSLIAVLKDEQRDSEPREGDYEDPR